ncbi:zinc-alpha-2-glycoprotein-like [Mantella aurantiaca]
MDISFLVSSFTSNTWDKKTWILLLLFYIIPSRHCEPHSLRYYYTGMAQSGEFKEFQSMTYVDDQEIMTCNKKKFICRPVASWMKNKEDASYWKNEHDLFSYWQKAFYENLQLLKHWHNNTDGLLVLQLWHGCEMQNDSTAHYHYGFEGRDYPLFDTIRTAWDPIMLNAQISDERRNIKRDIMESVQSYLGKICPDTLKKYVDYGKDKLEWKVPPEVMVQDKVTERVMRLQCLAYGFHPRAVDVKWVRNGEDHVPSYEITPILPHPDGTYQIKVSVEVPTSEQDTYSCHVDHSSLEEEITMLWNPKKNHIVILIKCFTILGAVLVPISLLIRMLFCKKDNGEEDSICPHPGTCAGICCFCHREAG